MRTSILIAVLPLLIGCGASLQQLPQDPAVSAHTLMVPVAGVGPDQVPDSFYAPRSGGRVHQASDIPAARGTPVVSVDDGIIVRMGVNRLGGNMIYATDPSAQLVYYYAHLDDFASNLAPGQWVSRGEVLGYVGTTGNAAGGAPHLHFQLMRRPPDGSYYGGEPIDARPYFALRGRLP